MSTKKFSEFFDGLITDKKFSSNSIPVGIVELKYTGEELLIESANTSFYRTANCVNEKFFEHYGRNYRKLIIDEDWEKIKRTIEDALDKNYDMFSCEYRIFFNTGATFWRKINASLITKAEDGVVFLCVLNDITDIKDVQVELEKEKERFYSIASLANSQLFEYAINTDTIYDITGGNLKKPFRNFSKEVLKYNVFIKNENADYLKILLDCFKNGAEEFYTEIKVIGASGKEEWVGVWGKTMFDENGKPVSIIGKTQNIDEVKRKELVFSDMKKIDNLTGTYMGNYARKLANEQFLKSTNKKHSVIVIDIDNFTQLNNLLGNNLCDQVLLNVSKSIRSIFSTDDIIGRIGGDEFFIYVENVISRQWLEELLQNINNKITLTYSGEKYKNCVRCSIGAFISEKGDTDFEKAFEKADYSLYISKSIGKNRYYIFSEKDEIPFMNKTKKESNFNEKFIYKKEIYAEREFNYEIAEFAFDVMESTKDVDSAVNILLDKVGSYFNLSRISILEINEKRDAYELSYQWINDSYIDILNETKILSPDKIEEMFSLYTKNDIFIYSEYPGFERGIEFKEYVDQGVKSQLRFIFKDAGNLDGYISFSDSNERIWSQNEIHALKMIGKIIFAYLLKMRAFKEAEETVERLTKYDSVTGIIKYDRFKNEIEKILKKKESLNKKFAIIYSDISNFKYLNERYGYKNGDEILKSFVSEMDSSKYEYFLTSRIFSDNFVTFAELNDDKVNESNILEYVNDYNAKFIAEKEKVFGEIKTSIVTGINVFEHKNTNPDKEYVNRIIDNANIARRFAKSSLADKAVLFDEAMETKMKKQVEILTSMERALINNEFVIVLQPKVKLSGNNDIVGAEALVRWVKQDGKVVPPMDFIPLFEKNGFVVNVDFCVYEQVCKFLCQRIKEGKRVVPVSVNVSRVHLEKDNFIERIDALVKKYKIPIELLEFELTENVFIENSNKAIEIMNKLRSMGFKVSMDDFGSGYSSLNLLKKLPVDVLKMDKGFLDTEEIKGNDEVVIKSIIDMAKKMQITVLCEGVETQKQAEFLQDAGCDLAQGYYFSKPIKVEEFKEML